MKNKLTFFLFLFSNLFAFSQNYTPTWSKFVGSTITTGGAVILDFAVDQSGNIITVGSFRGFSNFEDITTNNLIFTQNGGNDAFVAKYNSNGTLQWIKQFNGPNSDEFVKVKIDSNQDIIIGGNFQNSITCGNTTLISQNQAANCSACILKLDSNGELIWNKIYSSGQYNYISNIDIDDSNNVYFTVNNNYNLLIVKFSPNSTNIFEKQIYFPDYLEVRSISVDNNSNIYVGGEQRGRVDFNPDPTLEHVYNSVSNSIDGFVLKLDSIGVFKWVINLAGNSSSVQSVFQVTCSDNNTILVSEYSNESLNINPLGSAYNTIRDNGNFIVKYDSNGQLINYLPLQGTDILNPGYVGFLFNLEYSNDEIILAGQVFEAPDFDKSTNIVRGTQAAPNFVARYTKNLDYIDHFFFNGYRDGFHGYIIAKRVDESKIVMSFGANGFSLQNGTVIQPTANTNWGYVLTTISNQQTTTGFNLHDNNLFQAYPNPIIDRVNINVTGSIDSHFLVEIFNCVGIKTMQQKIGKIGGNISLDLSNLPSGSYYLRITSTNSKEIFNIFKI